MSAYTAQGRMADVNHADIANILITAATIIATALLGLGSWLWRHSTRLTRTEVEVKNNRSNIDAITRRSDANHIQVMAALTRLEDKMDRKADR